jgi:hypothetical protein
MWLIFTKGDIWIMEAILLYREERKDEVYFGLSFVKNIFYYKICFLVDFKNTSYYIDIEKRNQGYINIEKRMRYILVLNFCRYNYKYKNIYYLLLIFLIMRPSCYEVNFSFNFLYV